MPPKRQSANWRLDGAKLLPYFLDAFSHLYKRVCPSVRQSINPFVYPLVGHTRVKIARIYFSSIKFITKVINVFVAS